MFNWNASQCFNHNNHSVAAIWFDIGCLGSGHILSIQTHHCDSFIVMIKQKMPSFIDFEFCSSFLSINYSIVWFPRFGHLGTIQNTAGEEEPIGEKAPSLRNRIISFQQRNRPQPRADNFPTSRSWYRCHWCHLFESGWNFHE